MKVRRSEDAGQEAAAGAQPVNYAGVGGYAPDRRNYARLLLPYRQFEMAVRRFPDRPALVDYDGTRLTFKELDELIRRCASGLRNLGLQPGEGVCASVGNHWLQLPLFLALARMGGLFMATSRYLTRAEVDYQLRQAKPRLVIGDGGISFDELFAAASDDPVSPFTDEWAPFNIRFSSGTTGKPKMMVAPQRAAAFLNQVLVAELGLTHEDKQIVVGPLAHAALHFAIPQLTVGGLVYMREAFDKETLWRDCAELGITNVMVVPTMIASALAYEGDAPTLRNMTSLGAALAPALKQRLLDRFPHLDLFEMYGASENGMATCLRPKDQLRKPISVGQPCLGQEVLICDDEGEPVPTGTIGNIYVRGPMGITAYLGEVRPKPFPKHLEEEGWLPCGDLGSYDEEGFLFISDRRDDLILSGGLNVYPAEVEAAMLQVDGIAEAAVIGITDERWGQVVTAYYVGDADEQAITEHCRSVLAAYKIPRAMFPINELPKTSSGKISRKLVRDAVEAGRLPS